MPVAYVMQLASLKYSKNATFEKVLVLKVTPTTFWLKCINLSKCTKFCSIDKLEVLRSFNKKSSHGLANAGA